MRASEDMESTKMRHTMTYEYEIRGSYVSTDRLFKQDRPEFTSRTFEAARDMLAKLRMDSSASSARDDSTFVSLYHRSGTKDKISEVPVNFYLERIAFDDSGNVIGCLTIDSGS